jgi:hypothetical protein
VKVQGMTPYDNYLIKTFLVKNNHATPYELGQNKAIFLLQVVIQNPITKSK